MIGEQIAIGVDDVAIRRHRIEGPGPAVGGGDAGNGRPLGADRLDPVAHHHGAAKVLEQLDHAFDQCAGATARKPHAPLLFERVDQRIDRARLERIAADQQRVEAERLAQLRVLDVAADHRIDRAERLVAHQLRRRLHHRAKVEERLVAKFFIAFAEDVLAILEEALVTGDVLRVLGLDLREQRVVVVRIIEDIAVFPHQPVERRDRHQLDIVRQLAPAQRPQLLEARWIGDDGRPGIEDEALVFENIRPPAGLVALFDQRRRNSRRLEADGEGQPAEPAADYRCGLCRRHPVSFKAHALTSAARRRARARGAPADARPWSGPYPTTSTDRRRTAARGRRQAGRSVATPATVPPGPQHRTASC